MAKYKYTGGDKFIQGLPAIDIDDTTLTDEQKALLAGAIESGLYKAVTSGKPVKDSETKTTDNEGKANGT